MRIKTVILEIPADANQATPVVPTERTPAGPTAVYDGAGRLICLGSMRCVDGYAPTEAGQTPMPGNDRSSDRAWRWQLIGLQGRIGELFLTRLDEATVPFLRLGAVASCCGFWFIVVSWLR